MIYTITFKTNNIDCIIECAKEECWVLRELWVEKLFYFSDDLCATTIEYEPIIDTLINLLPDSAVIQTSTLITKIEGCTDGQYNNITTIETRYIYNSENDSINATFSIIELN